MDRLGKKKSRSSRYFVSKAEKKQQQNKNRFVQKMANEIAEIEWSCVCLFVRVHVAMHKLQRDCRNRE